MLFTDPAAMKSEASSEIKQEAADSAVDPRPVNVPRGFCTMPSSPSSSATTPATPATSGVKRKASSDIFDEIFSETPRRNHPSFTTTDTPSTTRSGDSALFSDLSDISIATSDTPDERIEISNIQAVTTYTPKVKVPHCPQKPTSAMFMKLIKGPQVEVLVGSKKTSFELPKNLLSHYSPVFDRCFNGEFKEGNTQTMELPEDTVEDFEVFVDYIFHHSIADVLSIERCGKAAVRRSISFLSFADKYDLGDVSSAVYTTLRPALVHYRASVFEAEYIEIIFAVTKDGNCLRELVAQAALSFSGKRRGAWGNSPKIPAFQKQENEVEGFGLALYRALKASELETRYNDPFCLTQLLGIV
ncbi:hypothetical protein BTUL_0005g01370 [Botrytis tulipae]|uniref:BTB domain-containing protein n=1 Tax=Botrytis tulipae TaxID=87230 RepID=A0A4Z1F710_9HELO|nr:hypothetical protein BTUL_0005g01370 [Botrytis tulipae]